VGHYEIKIVHTRISQRNKYIHTNGKLENGFMELYRAFTIYYDKCLKIHMQNINHELNIPLLHVKCMLPF
jgi:hypothetical protein